MPHRRDILKTALGLAMTGPLGSAWAQADYPTRPVRLIVPYPAGGGTDAFARMAGERLAQHLGQAVIVDNKPGAGTMIGADLVAKSPADGYTVLLGDTGTYAVNRSLFQKVPYDVERDFAPVSLTARFALLLVAHPSLDVTSVSDLLRVAKARPGAVNYASVGIGSPHHLAMELFKRQAGLFMTHIAYRGGAPAVADLLPGRVPLMFLDVVSAAQHVQAGKIKVLGVASPTRLAQLPNVPTVAEQGFPGFEAWAWQGLAVPAGTPTAAVQRLNAAFGAVAAEPEFRSRMAEMGTELIPSSPAAMAAYVKAETDKWGRLIRANKISAE